jgi:serine protease
MHRVNWQAAALILLLLVACDGQAPLPGGQGAISGTLVFPGNIGGPRGSSADPLDASKIAVFAGVFGAGQGVRVVPGEVIVRFSRALSPQSVPTLSVGAVTLSAERSVAGSAWQLFRAEGVDGAQTLALAEALAARPEVEAAYPNWLLHALAQPNDELFSFQWHYPAMSLPDAWAIETGSGTRVTVAVADTGIVRHPDLDANLLPGFDFVERNGDPIDPGGQTGYHGAHVAGTIGAVTDNGLGVAGVNWGARIVPVRVLDADGAGSTADILDGIAWAAGRTVAGVPNNPNPARVINLSLGGDIGQLCPSELDSFFGDLSADGVIIVASAGNDNANAGSYFPASCSNVITVGATGPTNERAPYSNYGAVIDVMAPGGDTSSTFTVGGVTAVTGVLSTVIDDVGSPIYAFYQGTSMAAPHVAGLVSLMLARDPSLDFATVLRRLQDASAALSAGACGRPAASDCGAGLVDAAAALTSGAGTLPPPPPVEEVPTYVAAFYCLPGPSSACDDFDLDRSRVTTVEISANEVPYRVGNLEPGNYLAAAWQDLNRDDEVDEGEPFGVHPNLLTVRAGETIANVTIFLEPFSPLGARQAQRLQGAFKMLGP